MHTRQLQRGTAVDTHVHQGVSLLTCQPRVAPVHVAGRHALACRPIAATSGVCDTYCSALVLGQGLESLWRAALQLGSGVHCVVVRLLTPLTLPRPFALLAMVPRQQQHRCTASSNNSAVAIS